MLDYIEWIWFWIGFWVILRGIFDFYNTIKGLRGNEGYEQSGLSSWALITGSTDGIGLGFAEFLASQGFNIVLIGRNSEKLKAVSKSLEERFPIKPKTIIKDFSMATNNPSDFFQDIKYQTKGLDISILVNNVGTGIGTGYFHSLREKTIINAHSLNLWPIVFLTKLYLPDLISRKNRSGIINLSSITSIFPMPYNSGYSAAKSFDDLFSLVIAEEVKYLCKGKNMNIDVLSLKPGFVDTPLVKDEKIKPLLINRFECAWKACKALGIVNYTSGHWKHQLFATITNLSTKIAPYIVMSRSLNLNNE